MASMRIVLMLLNPLVGTFFNGGMMNITLLATTVALLALTATSAAAATNLVPNGDFSDGEVGFTTGYTATTLFSHFNTGHYDVLPIGNVVSVTSYYSNTSGGYGWNNVTTDPSGGNSNVFLADGSQASNPNTLVWKETVDVAPQTNYVFSFYAAEISTNSAEYNAIFVPTIDGVSGVAHTLTSGWAEYTYDWNSGSQTSAVLSLADTQTSNYYNDFVFTDVSLTAVGGVPELSTWAMMLTGFAGVGAAAIWKGQKKAQCAA